MKFHILSTLGLVLAAGSAFAQSNSAYVVTNPHAADALTGPAPALQERVDAFRFGRPQDNSLRLIADLGDVPGASVSRELAFTPTRPDLFRLVYGNATAIYIDPYVDYMRRSEYRLDDNFSILRAQQLYRTLTNPGVTVVRNPLADQPTDRRTIKPRAIFHVPEGLQRPKEPAIQKVDHRKVVRAD